MFAALCLAIAGAAPVYAVDSLRNLETHAASAQRHQEASLKAIEKALKNPPGKCQPCPACAGGSAAETSPGLAAPSSVPVAAAQKEVIPVWVWFVVAGAAVGAAVVTGVAVGVTK